MATSVEIDIAAMDIGEWQGMKSVRSNHEDPWDEIYTLCQPFRGDVTTIRAEGDERMFITETTAATDSKQWMNFILAMIYPNKTSWMIMGDPDEDDQGQELLGEVTAEYLFALQESNYYEEFGTIVEDLSLIGNCFGSIWEKPARLSPSGSTFGGFGYTAVPMWHVWWNVAKDGTISRAYRIFEMSVVEAYRFFDGKPGVWAEKKMASGKGLDDVCYLMRIFPNENFIPGAMKTKQNKPWIGRWTALDDSQVKGQMILEVGFNHQPIIFGRQQVVVGETYGRGQGHMVRPDAKALNELKRKLLNAADYDLDKPLIVEDDSIVRFDFGPGGTALIKGPVNFPPTHLGTGADYVAANGMVAEERSQIHKVFMADVIADPETEARSAAAIFERQGRGLVRTSGPADQYRNLIIQTVKIGIEIMDMAGAIPAYQEYKRLKGHGRFNVELLGPFFTAQKQIQHQNNRAFVEEAIALSDASGDPRYKDRIDPDGYSLVASELNNVDPRIVRSNEEIDLEREERAEQEAIVAQIQAMQQGAETGKTIQEARAVGAP